MREGVMHDFQRFCDRIVFGNIHARKFHVIGAGGHDFHDIP